MATYRGSCHCRQVVFEIKAPAHLTVYDCNCSICRLTGFLHLIVDDKNFKLIKGANVLTTYSFNTGTASHQFCPKCGIKSFYVPRSHPKGFSVNARCLDTVDIKKLEIKSFDGANWESSVTRLRRDV